MIAANIARVKGFTLIEVLAACVILAGGLTALFAVSTRCMERVGLNEKYGYAWQLLDRQLSLIEYMGIGRFIEQGINDGQNEVAGTQYQWQISTFSEDIDNLYRVTVTITWMYRGRSYSICAATRMIAEGG